MKIGQKNNEKEDTKYTNIVNEGYINECEDIKFKITSKNESNVSYSKAFLDNEILDTIENNIYDTNEKPEELMIKRVVQQYKQPKIKLERTLVQQFQPYSTITDSYLNDKHFLFIGGTIDYENNSIDANFMEVNL